MRLLDLPRTNAEAVAFLQERGVNHKQRPCPRCETAMVLQLAQNRWQCPKLTMPLFPFLILLLNVLNQSVLGSMCSELDQGACKHPKHPCSCPSSFHMPVCLATSTSVPERHDKSFRTSLYSLQDGLQPPIGVSHRAGIPNFGCAKTARAAPFRAGYG